ncbi:ceramide kinase [Hyalella azteca]|uniref:Ceramide kinase n=1 Tax=Hyalella azteca TaxID=294128 RepID=A0A8B7N392_HYAAZ|nr:ceramide kinase [Hyalella azteca]
MLENCFSVKGRAYLVQLDHTGLSWHLADSTLDVYHVPAHQLLSCWNCVKGCVDCCPSLADVFHPTSNESKTYSEPSTTDLLNNHEQHPTVTSYAAVSATDVDVFVTKNGHAITNASPKQIFPKSGQIGPIPSPKTSIAFEENAPDLSSKRPRLRAQIKNLSLISCKHSKKDKHALAIEICERVLPSSSIRCGSGSASEVVRDWQTRVIVFNHDYRDVVLTWYRALWKIILDVPKRPCRLVAIVNPFGGKKTGADIYARRVAPLLRRAAIAVTVAMTTHLGHAESLAEEAANTPDVDGVVVVSGDGVVAEVALGLFKYATHKHGGNLDDMSATVPKSTIRIGFIAGGSTNAYAFALNGSDCPTTSTLQIIMGAERFVDIAGVYSENRLLHLSVTAIHLGFVSRTMENSIKLRALGPIRDVISGTKELILNRSDSYSFRFLGNANQESSPYDEDFCHAGCVTCNSDSPDQAASAWIETQGDYHSVTAALNTLECRYCKYGLSPACHIGDGTADLLLNYKAPLITVLKRFVTMSSFKDHLRRNKVDAFRSSEIHFKMDALTPINCDGELRHSAEFIMKVHRQRLGVFSWGREPVSSIDLSRVSNKFIY